ncbi:PREDICTED: zinc finger BED domain-containing protein RICESLEEPER 2-like [Ipomoea nil]|uniref:zinc finger BED domain-containing protein RICESLEEPER 2-like n=1 Tax=Ipomoea nil TaxID=35883 RepID=UPI0009012044|nr:PREDICTED: zinc finger BED domain-containing protein RICESLEEPER 2-like [Ipomoea nil]
MESISGLSGSQPEVEATVVETNTSQSQQPLPPLVPKKRKVVETRSPVRDHFEKIKGSEGIVVKGKCLYCVRVYCSESKKHGTSYLRLHVVNCLKILTLRIQGSPCLLSNVNLLLLELKAVKDQKGIVEGQGFRKFVFVCCPRFKIPSRWTISRDIFKIFSDERLNLKKFFRTSSQRGESIAKALESCLMDWGLKSVFSVTVDNASRNDTALGFLKKKFVSWGCTAVRSKYLHMRCIAHIINLVVQDGLKESDSAVKKVRDSVRYVRSSPARLQRFRELADVMGVEAKKSLCLDVPTRGTPPI